MPSPPSNPQVETLSPEEERLFESFKQDIQISTNNTGFFKKYFQTTNYRNLVKFIFSKFSQNIRTLIKQFYFKTTNYEPRDQKTYILSNTSYDKLCDQMSIIKSPTDGDCFFKAVADGLNIHNYENQDSKIIYANYGKTELFTITILREIVYRYISELNSSVIDDMLSISESQVEPLNRKFSESINGLKTALNISDLTPDQYVSELNNVYNSNSNFLVYKPNVIPIDITEYENPFRILTKSEISRYIKSKDYWANDVAIEAICSKLKICIIPIEKYSDDNLVKLRAKNTEKLKALLTNNTLTKESCSKNVMFLFYKNNHYELIRFKYLTKPVSKLLGEGSRETIDYTGKWYTVFKSTDLSPPLHILLLIYGTIYSKINTEHQQNFSIYHTLMDTINNAVIRSLALPEKAVFIKLFNTVFPDRVSIENRLQASSRGLTNDEESQNQAGGQGENQGQGQVGYYNRPYYYQPPYYNRPLYNQPLNNIAKKPTEHETSKIAYKITIEMELHPGTSLTPEQLNQSKCNSKYNAIRKAFSEFTGRPYVIPPVYPPSKNNTTKKGGKILHYGHRKTRKTNL